MKKKLFALILSILFLTGCTSEYNITIDEDLKITEEITVLGDERFGITGNYNEESLFNILTNTYEEFYSKENVSNYNKWTELGNIASSYKNEYSNFDDWKNSFYVNKFFPDMSITTDEDNIVNINSSLIDSFWLFVPGMEEDALVEELLIKIKVPYVVTSSNADVIDEENNVYTFKYNFQSSSKRINLSFDKTRKFTYGIETSQIITYVGIIFAIIILGVFLFFKFVKKGNKNNDL